MTQESPSRHATIRGTVSYRERVALPPSAVVEVTLQDVSLADAPATVLGRQHIPATGRQVPIPFEIPYDPAAIDPKRTYSVSARIVADGTLLFVSDTRHAVLTRGAPRTADLLLVAVTR